jgi:membrane-associated phospholipid phosphatase
VAYLRLLQGRLTIFVPALMSVGFVFWVGALVRDQLRRRRGLSLERRAAIAGTAAAAIVQGRRPPDDPQHTGLAERRLYVVIAIPFLVAAVYVGLGAAANYLRDGGYVAEIAWLLALSMLLSLLFASIGTVLALLFWQWPALSPSLRRLAVRGPFGGLPPDAGQYRRPGTRLVEALWFTTGAAALLAMVVGSSRGFLRRIDEPLLDLASDAGWLDVLSSIDPLGSTYFAIAVGALLGLASFRCRPLVVAYPAALATAFLVNNVLRVIISRGRPPEGPLAGRFDSFPSGHLILMTVLVGLLPLTVAVILRTVRWLRTVRVLAAVTVLAGGAHRVHDEVHWPTDVVGGVALGAAIVLAVEWVIAHEAWHRRCGNCPWAPAVPEPHHDRGAVPLSVGVARLFGYLAHFGAAGAAIALAVLSLTKGFPTDPEGAAIEVAVQRPIQLVLAGLVSMGALVSWRWPPVGAVMMAIAASGLGVFAGLQYEPPVALAITVLVLVPAVLVWLSWQHDRSPAEVGALAMVATLAVFGTWLGANRVYSQVYGPTHTESAARLPGPDVVEWFWMGALTPDGVSVVARLVDDEPVRLVVEGEGRRWVTEEVEPDADRLARIRVEGLEPDGSYTLAFEVGGATDAARGRGTFHTPASGPFSFRMVAGSSARTDSNGAVFDAMAAEEPLLYLALGDIHHANISVDDRERFVVAYTRTLTQPGQAALYRSVPVSYVWDDHDYASDGADASSASRAAARSAFRAAVPSHPLTGTGAIHRAFTVGRVRFVVTDTRSERTGETMLGADQLRWLERELVDAAQTHALVVWMNPSPWIDEAGGDGWGSHPDERREIAEVLAGADVDNLLMVSGGAHMLAFDDGTNSAYASDGAPGFPVLHTGALDRPGNVRGGPYSGGAQPGSGQYAVIDVVDDGDRLQVVITGKDHDGAGLIAETLSFER